MQPIFLDYDHTIVTARCGAALAGTSYAFGDAVRRGLPVSYGTDAPVESLDPPAQPLCGRHPPPAVRRRALAAAAGRHPRAGAFLLHAGQRLAGVCRSRKKAALAPGFLADFTVLDRDYFTVPEADIPRLRVQATVTGGQVVYRA